VSSQQIAWFPTAPTKWGNTCFWAHCMFGDMFSNAINNILFWFLLCPSHIIEDTVQMHTHCCWSAFATDIQFNLSSGDMDVALGIRNGMGAMLSLFCSLAPHMVSDIKSEGAMQTLEATKGTCPQQLSAAATLADHMLRVRCRSKLWIHWVYCNLVHKQVWLKQCRKGCQSVSATWPLVSLTDIHTDRQICWQTDRQTKKLVAGGEVLCIQQQMQSSAETHLCSFVVGRVLPAIAWHASYGFLFHRFPRWHFLLWMAPPATWRACDMSFKWQTGMHEHRQTDKWKFHRHCSCSRVQCNFDKGQKLKTFSRHWHHHPRHCCFGS